MEHYERETKGLKNGNLALPFTTPSQKAQHDGRFKNSIIYTVDRKNGLTEGLTLCELH